MIEPARPMALVGKKSQVLTEVALPVNMHAWEGLKLDQLVARMLATCRVKSGIAIAAPQVGVGLRIIVTWDGRVVVNPEIEVEDDSEKATETEGCLSLPGRLFAVERPVECSLSYIDATGADGWAHLDGLDARMFQHEVDHLNGILISQKGKEVPNAEFGAMKF
jgi:peptide deformylase